MRSTSDEILLYITSNTVTLFSMFVMLCATGDEKQVSKEAMSQQAAEAHSAEIRSLGDDIGASVSQSVNQSVSQAVSQSLHYTCIRMSSRPSCN